MTANVMVERTVLAFDLGTSALKGGLVSTTGQLLWTAEYPLVGDADESGRSEQSAEAWWQQVRAAALDIGSSGLSPSNIVAIAVTGQFSSVVPVDEAGQPTAPCVMWDDTRGAEYMASVGATEASQRMWLAVTGSAAPRGSGRAINHLAFLERALADPTDRTRWLLEPVDYLTMRLTGKASATRASMSVVSVFDVNEPESLSYHHGLLRELGVNPDRLPPLLPVGSIAGELTSSAAAELGLPAGIPVISGIPDNQAATIGSGAVEPWQAHFVISSTAWVSTLMTERVSDGDLAIGAVPSMWPGEHLLMTNQDTAGTSLNWLRSMVSGFAGRDVSIAELLVLAESSPPGARGVRFAPWLNGERTPLVDPTIRASLTGLGVGSTAGDVARAVLEGVALNARWMLDEVERVTKHQFASLRFLGGGARSDLWSQIVADAMGRPIERVAEPTHAGLRGLALYALVSLGHLSRSELGSMVQVERVFEPNPLHAATYAEALDGLRATYRATRSNAAYAGEPPSEAASIDPVLDQAKDVTC